MTAFNGDATGEDIASLTVLGGQNKYLEPENAVLTLKKGEIAAIVGPTGSGKSRLLADIECLAQREMHARSRFLKDVEATVARCTLCANGLAGETFEPGTKVTQLSGGQSRALMIADTAYMSTSPLVLIDEIENGGIVRVIETSSAERAVLNEIEALDNTVQSLRNRLRAGELIESLREEHYAGHV